MHCPWQIVHIVFRQKLTIYKLHPDDSGKYFCRINDIETSAWLTVTRNYSSSNEMQEIESV